MTVTHNNWRICDICGYEGMCRPANKDEAFSYDAEDVCERCDFSEESAVQKDKMKCLLIKIRDSGQWFNSALELDFEIDGEKLLKEIEALVGEKK